MNDHDIDVIVEKVRKLLALSKSPNHHEATLAAQRAHDLIIKHNLTMDHLEECEIERHSFGLHRIQPKKWRLMLATNVAEYYFCKFVLTQKNHIDGKSYRFDMFGKRHHVVIAESIYKYLEDAIIRITRENVKKSAKYKFRESFRYGMAVEISTRLRKMKQDRQRGGPDEEKALIIREDERIEEKLRELSLENISIRQNGIRKNAFERGVDAGADVGLNSHMTHNTRRIAQ